MVAVYEHEGPDQPLEPGQVDGMMEFVDSEDDVLSTDWDADIEDAPHEFLQEKKHEPA